MTIYIKTKRSKHLIMAKMYFSNRIFRFRKYFKAFFAGNNIFSAFFNKSFGIKTKQFLTYIKKKFKIELKHNSGISIRLPSLKQTKKQCIER